MYKNDKFLVVVKKRSVIRVQVKFSLQEVGIPTYHTTNGLFGLMIYRNERWFGRRRRA